MRVGIDATCWANRRGYGRFTRGLLTALLESDKDRQYVLFVDDHTDALGDLPQQAERVVVPTSKGATEAASATTRRSFGDMWAMTRAVARCRLDAFFFPSVYTYFPTITDASIILGVHDVIAEDYPQLIFPDKKRRKLWELKGWLAHKQADYIMTVSEHAKGGIIRHFGHEPDKVFVIDEAADPIFRPLPSAELNNELLSKHGLSIKDRFLLYLGGINPHKNLINLVECFAQIIKEENFKDMKLAIIGDIKNDGFTPGLTELRQRIEQLDLAEHVVFTGYVSDENAVHFLNVAKAVVLPSFAEGFGLPALEGAACGTPVIATRNSPLPDLLAGGGIFVDPAKPAQLLEAMRNLLGDEQERHQMGQVAKQKAQKLTWQHSANQMRKMLSVVEESRS
ncbi:MAG TPA: glycosyltransferase family 1 protein [Planktothrix sp.]|jgi:glycosyltransferase involved in cell wall biosynthesis